MVKVKVKFYGVIKDVVGVPTAEVELEDSAVIMDLLNRLRDQYGQGFYDRVLDEALGIRSYIRLYLNNQEVDPTTLETTRLLSGGPSAEVILYVMSAGTGG